MNYATAGDASTPALLLHPRPDRVVVGLRGGDAAARRALPGLRRRPPRPGPQHAHARSLHARQHGQRPRPLHRRGHRPADDRERPVLGRRALGVAVGVRQARSGRRRLLRGPAAVRVGGAAGDRPRHPPVDRPDVRPLEHLPRRPVVDRRVGRDARRRARPAAGVDGGVPDRRRAARRTSRSTTPSGAGRSGPARSRRRATTSGCCAASRCRTCCSRTTSASSTRRPACSWVRSPTCRPSGCRSSCARPACRSTYRSFPTVGHSMHGTEPDLYVDTLLDWVATLDS